MLVEEIQSDCIRDLARLYSRARFKLSEGQTTFYNYGLEMKAQVVVDQVGPFLDKFKKRWQEAMLTAVMTFVFEELGISNLFYHSFETGNKMKHLSFSLPPRTLYSELTRKFCFAHRDQAPEFLCREKKIKRKLKRLDGGHWFYMAA